MTGILVMIVLGLIIGAVAKLLMPGNDPGGIIVTILLGVAGALVGASSAAPSASTRRASLRAS